MSNARYATPSETLYMFMGWLTTRHEPATISRYHDASVIVDLIQEFCDEQDIPEPRPGWEDRFKSMYKPMTSDQLWNYLNFHFGHVYSIGVGMGDSGGTVHWGKVVPNKYTYTFEGEPDLGLIASIIEDSWLAL